MNARPATAAQDRTATRRRQRDRVTLRRALRAGAVAASLVAVPLLISALAGDTGGRAGLAVVLLALTIGGMVASGWLLLAALLDLLADDPPGRGRWVWTAAVVAVTSLLPLLLAAAGG